MTAVNITNHHTGPLAVGGVNIGPGRTAAVARWDQVKGTSTIKTWLKLGILKEEGATPSPQDPDVVRDPSVQPSTKALDDMTKAELVDYGKAKGLSIDAGDRKEDIRAQIDDAEQAG